MFNKQDRERAERIDKNLLNLHQKISDMELSAIQWRKAIVDNSSEWRQFIEKGLDTLLQSHAALEQSHAELEKTVRRLILESRESATRNYLQMIENLDAAANRLHGEIVRVRHSKPQPKPKARR